LISLDLSENKIGSQGISRLLSTLSANIHLTRLNLASTACDGDIKEDLQHCIHTNEVLQDLNLSDNVFGDCMQGVFDGSSLVSLELSGCRLNDYSGKEICAALAASDCIERLVMRDNFFTKEVGYEILELLQHNESLLKIDVASNHFDRFAVEALNTICSRNKSTSHHQMLSGMRKEYVHLSIQGSKIPELTDRVERSREEHSKLLDEIEDLRSEIEALEHQTGVALTSTNKTMIEFRTMMTNEEKLIADMQQKQRDVEAEFAESMKELTAKCEIERRDFAAIEGEAIEIERVTAEYLKECETVQSGLREEIDKCETMLEEVTRASRNRRRLREFEIPEYPYAEEEARRRAEREEELRTQMALTRQRENEIFQGLGISAVPSTLTASMAAKKSERARKKTGGSQRKIVS
jgi:hypothetical protein